MLKLKKRKKPYWGRTTKTRNLFAWAAWLIRKKHRELNSLPHGVVLGDGWERLEPVVFEYNTSATVNPSIDVPLGALSAGSTYRVLGNITILTGTAPRILFRLGSDSVNLLDLSATGEFDITAKAGADNSLLKVIVSDNSTTLRCVIKPLLLQRMS